MTRSDNAMYGLLNPFFQLELDPWTTDGNRIQEAVNIRRQEWLRMDRMPGSDACVARRRMRQFQAIERVLADAGERERLASEAQMHWSTWSSDSKTCQHDISQICDKGYILDSEAEWLMVQYGGMLGEPSIGHRVAAALARSSPHREKSADPSMLMGEIELAVREGTDSPTSALFIRGQGVRPRNPRPIRHTSADLYWTRPISTARRTGRRATHLNNLWSWKAVAALALTVLVIGFSIWATRSALRHVQPSTAQQVTMQKDVRNTLVGYFHLVAYAASTGDCSSLPNVSTGTVLTEEQALCVSDSTERVHKEIRDLSPPQFERIHVSGTATTAIVSKRQNILFIHDQCGVPDDVDPCGYSGHPQTLRNLRYSTIYHLVERHGKWLVSIAALRRSR